MFDKIKDKIRAEDVPIYLGGNELKLQEYLRKQKIEVSFDKICKDLQFTHDQILEMNNNISLHFKNKLAPKALYKSMLPGNKEEFKRFFQRPDLDVCLLMMTKIYDIRKNMKNLDTPAFEFMIDNWKKHRGY